MNKEELEVKYICPVCLKRGWKRKVEVEISDGDEWQWRCTYIRCAASREFQGVLEPALDKEARPKIGDTT